MEWNDRLAFLMTNSSILTHVTYATLVCFTQNLHIHSAVPLGKNKYILLTQLLKAWIWVMDDLI